jgi:hypothetical protein
MAQIEMGGWRGTIPYHTKQYNMHYASSKPHVMVVWCPSFPRQRQMRC